jgi:hypothetical protein
MTTLRLLRAIWRTGQCNNLVVRYFDFFSQCVCKEGLLSEKTDKFSKELEDLVIQGESLYMAIQYMCHPKEFKSQIEKGLGKNKLEELLEKMPDFKKGYQAWYSKAQAVVKQILPDRLSDFNSYYEYPRPRKDITFQNYMIKDALQGLTISWAGEVKVNDSAAIPEFVQQLNIVKAARDALGSRLLELRSVLQADLFDSEIESARALAKAGYLRAAGAICGVVIEKHLAQVCDTYGIAIQKKNPSISDLNQALRDNDSITVPQWRFNQHLADIRNLCDHSKGREPTKEEIEDLLSGTDKTLKTVF